MTHIQLSSKINKQISSLVITNKKAKWSELGFSKEEITYISKKIKQEDNFITINRFESLVFVQLIEEFEKKNEAPKYEAFRGIGNKVANTINVHKYESFQISTTEKLSYELLCVAEGAALGNYQFIKYLSNQKSKHT